MGKSRKVLLTRSELSDPGPAFRAALDVLDLGAELVGMMPKSMASQRKELASRMEALRILMIENLCIEHFDDNGKTKTQG